MNMNSIDGRGRAIHRMGGIAAQHEASKWDTLDQREQRGGDSGERTRERRGGF
jgi:hypothetical protein